MAKDLALLRNEVNRNPAIYAALHHRSARTEASAILEKEGLQPESLDNWESLGKAAIDLYAARSLFGSSAWTSAGNASRAHPALKHAICDRFLKELLSADLIRFGESFPASDRGTHQKSLTSTLGQLIGALCFYNGFAQTTRQLLPFIVPLRELRVTAGKDDRTLIQEFAQSKKLGLPAYTIAESTGKDHEQQFVAIVRLPNGLTAKGVGNSKRSAEQAAAGELIDKNFAGIRKVNDLTLALGCDVAKAAESIPKLPNWLAAEEVANKWDLEKWASKMISLSFVHSSYTNLKNSVYFGKDNKLLAFVGSYVMQWLSRDALLSFGCANVITSAGLSNLNNKAIAPENAIAGFSEVFQESLYLVGSGEKKPFRDSLKIEMLQAFIGAIFLINEENVLKADSILNSLPLAKSYFNNIVRESANRDEVMPSKTLLQERCQSIAVRTIYETEVIGEVSSITIEPTVCFRSPWLVETLCVTQPKRTYPIQAFRGRKEHESELADRLIETVDIAIGIKPNNENRRSPKIESWFIRHLIAELSQQDFSAASPRVRRLGKTNSLGVGFLSSGQFTYFDCWLGSLLSLNSPSDTFITNLTAFYVQARKDVHSDRDQKHLLGQLQTVEEYLQALDPLSPIPNIRESSEYRLLVQLAAGCRLISNDAVTTSLGEIWEEARIMFGRRQHLVALGDCVDAEILEVKGAHMALLDALYNHVEHADGQAILDASRATGELVLILKWNQQRDTLNRQPFVSIPLVGLLKNVLPITAIYETSSFLRISIGSIAESFQTITSLKYWWAFHLRGGTDIATYHAIAAALHDMKNEVLAFSAGATSARESHSQREKYQLAADASLHIEKALEKARSVRALINSSLTLPTELVHVGKLVHTIVSEIWSWIPTSVSFVPPSTRDNMEIWSNSDGIRSIVVNLVRNSVEAMSGAGKLQLEYLIDEESTELIFEVTDFGPGFSYLQLEELRVGRAISSSKKDGTGVGLLTVLSVARELCAAVEFANHDGGGSRITITVPSCPPQIDAPESEKTVISVSEVSERIVLQ